MAGSVVAILRHVTIPVSNFISVPSQMLNLLDCLQDIIERTRIINKRQFHFVRLTFKTGHKKNKPSK